MSHNFHWFIVISCGGASNTGVLFVDGSASECSNPTTTGSRGPSSIDYGQLDDASSSLSMVVPEAAAPPSLAVEDRSAIDLTYLGQAALMFSLGVSFITPPEGVGCSDVEGVGCSDVEREEGGVEKDGTDFSEDPGDRYIAEQLGIVLNAEGGDPLARMA